MCQTQWSRTFDFLVLLAFVGLMTGCGNGSTSQAPLSTVHEKEAQFNDAFAEVLQDESPAPNSGEPAPANAGEAVGALGAGQQAADSLRKIVYRGSLEVMVDDFDDTPDINGLVAEHGGFISASRVLRDDNSKYGEWTVRLPVDRLGGFLASLRGIGEITEQTLRSEEVTAEYYDLTARIKNKQHEETRLHEYLKENSKSLDDILRVELEMSRVRGEIERMEGRIRVLNNLTALSTITLKIRETPAVAAVEPEPEPATFGQRVSEHWTMTTTAMLKLGQDIVIALVMIGPWLIVLLPFMIGAVLLMRRLLRRLEASSPFSETPA
ncbi:MAG: DUF4349 domain-containing protein [Pirellulaceae bacterium]|jgi:hypothetical protein|nr:DUF4349 domain-containing protein [Pirellulaceae bacterium]